VPRQHGRRPDFGRSTSTPAWQATVATFGETALFLGGLLAGWIGIRFEAMALTG
jgi:hypothetical protein